MWTDSVNTSFHAEPLDSDVICNLCALVCRSNDGSFPCTVIAAVTNLWGIRQSIGQCTSIEQGIGEVSFCERYRGVARVYRKAKTVWSDEKDRHRRCCGHTNRSKRLLCHLRIVGQSRRTRVALLILLADTVVDIVRRGVTFLSSVGTLLWAVGLIEVSYCPNPFFVAGVT